MRRLLLLPLLLVACGSEVTTRDGVELGEELVHSPSLSASSFNTLSCASCHQTSEPADDRILPGYPLLGAANRPELWGGNVPDLKTAVDFCLVYFMKGDPLDPASDEARGLYEWLLSVADRGPQDSLPLSVVLAVEEAPPRGDPELGREIHRRACQVCHGAPHTGEGGLVADAVMLPDQARDEAAELFPGYDPAVVFTEKVRHGQFFGVGGVMPLYSLEALSDEELGALLAFYGL